MWAARLAWQEMEVEARVNQSTLLLATTEQLAYRHLQAVQAERGLQEVEEEPYIEPDIRDSRGLISLYMAVVSAGQLAAGRVEIPRVRLPLAALAATNLTEWQVFAAAYSFLADGLGVPGGDSVSACREREDSKPVFRSSPAVLAVSLNNEPLQLETAELELQLQHSEIAAQASIALRG